MGLKTLVQTFAILLLAPLVAAQQAYVLNRDLAGSSQLCLMSLVDGQLAVRGPVPSSLFALAQRDDGFLYSIDYESDQLVLIDPQSAAITEVGPLGIDIAPTLDLALDSSHRLWLLRTDTAASPALYQVDTTSGAASLIGTLLLGDNDPWPSSIAAVGNILYGDGGQEVVIGNTTGLVTVVGNAHTNAETLMLSSDGHGMLWSLRLESPWGINPVFTYVTDPATWQVTRGIDPGTSIPSGFEVDRLAQQPQAIPVLQPALTPVLVALIMGAGLIRLRYFVR